MYSWMKVYHEVGGHRLFFDSNSDRYSIADNSGPLPHNTDDGVLWVDTSRPFIVYDEATICIPVNTSEHVLATLDFANKVLDHVTPAGIDVPPDFKRLFRFVLRAF